MACHRPRHRGSIGVGVADHKDTAFVPLKALLKPFGLTQFYTDDWGAYQRLLHPAFHPVGKTKTQTIERKHLTLLTRMKRLARKTICFSNSIWYFQAEGLYSIGSGAVESAVVK